MWIHRHGGICERGRGSNSTVRQCTFNTSSVQWGGISKHRNRPLSLGETFHGELGFVSSSTMRGILQVSLLNGKVHSSFCHHFKTKWCALHFAVMCGFGNSGFCDLCGNWKTSTELNLSVQVSRWDTKGQRGYRNLRGWMELGLLVSPSGRKVGWAAWWDIFDRGAMGGKSIQRYVEEKLEVKST